MRNEDIDGGLTKDFLDGLVDAEGEALEYDIPKRGFYASPLVLRAARKWDAAVYAALLEMVKIFGGPDDDEADEDFVDDLWEGDASEVVLVTLLGRVGIEGGEWDDFYSEERLKKIRNWLSAKLRPAFADLQSALINAAYAQSHVESEREEPELPAENPRRSRPQIVVVPPPPGHSQRERRSRR